MFVLLIADLRCVVRTAVRHQLLLLRIDIRTIFHSTSLLPDAFTLIDCGTFILHTLLTHDLFAVANLIAFFFHLLCLRLGSIKR